MREVYDDNISSVPSLNKCLALSTPSIVFVAICSIIGFVEWHWSRDGWVSYANDFPHSCIDCKLIIGFSLGVPTRKGTVEEIGFATLLGKGKEKKGKKSAKGKPETKKGIKDPKVGQGTKKRKTSIASKRLPTSEESGEVASTAVGGRSSSKEVSHPLILKIRVKTGRGF